MSDHPRDVVYLELEAERLRQDKFWGVQNHPDGTGGDALRELAARARIACNTKFGNADGSWALILLEEVMEAFAEIHSASLREELVQCAAVCIAWVEAIDRRPSGA